MIKLSIEIKRSDKYVDYNISATNNRGYITIYTSDWINKPWMFYELPALKFEIYTETNGELVKYQNFSREIRTYNPVYSPLGVLNVTIDIRNVPEEFILRITPIFDNDAIAARNMLIENGIENGDIWGSDQGVPTQLFNLDLEFIECDGEYVPPTPPVPPTHEETITGIPPITFDGSKGEPLVSWTILGNGQQTGTPSPDNIIMPTFCGVRTGNLADLILGKVPRISDGTLVTFAGLTCEYVPITSMSDTFSLTFDNPESTKSFYVFFYSGDTLLSTKDLNYGTTITTYGVSSAVDRMRIRIDYGKTTVSNVMLVKGSTALPYEPYGYKIPITCAGQTVPVYLGQTQTVRRIKKLVLTGAEDTYITVTTTNHIFSIRGVFNQAPELLQVGGFCTHYKYNNAISNLAGNMSNGDFVLNKIGNDYSFTIMDNSFSTSAEFQQYVQQQYATGTPVTIWYALAELETGIVNEPLCKIGDYADELHSADAGVTIPTTEGQNTLTVDADLQPSEMTITYIKEGQ